MSEKSMLGYGNGAFSVEFGEQFESSNMFKIVCIPMGVLKKNIVTRATVAWTTVSKNFLDMARRKHQKKNGANYLYYRA